MDVTFADDDSRIRIGNGPPNMAVLCHLALNILKRDASKGSVKHKRLRAGLDDAFLLRLLSQIGCDYPKI